MARSKNSPALFEVIRNAQQRQKEQEERQRQQQIAAELEAHSPAAALLRSPLYWFKGKHAHEAAKIDAPVMREIPPAPAAQNLTPAVFAPLVVSPVPRAETRPAVETSVSQDEAAEVEPTPAKSAEVAPPPPAPLYAPARTSAAAEAARQVREELAAQEAPAAEPLFAGPAYDAPPTSPFGHDADEPRPAQLNLKLNYTTAAISAFAIAVAFSVAYIIGTAGAVDGKQVAVVPSKRPEVLNVARPNDVPAVKPAPVQKPVSANVAPTDDDARANLPASNDSLVLDTLGKPIAVPTSVKRVVGYQYLVLLSFPREEDAKDLVKYLAQNGVPATAEKALPEYAKTWTSVVTARGFEHTKKNPAFDAYSAALKDLLLKYAGDSKFRKTFKLDVYTWRTAR